MSRAVDRAMDQERPEKAAIRVLWREIVLRYREAYPDDEVPLYLTLSGAEGRDIEVLEAAGVIRRTEVGAIEADDQAVIVAVESNSDAVLRLQSKFPGMKILELAFQNLVRSTTLLAWPQGEDVRFCRARVINLDLNLALRFETVAGELQFAPLQWIRKLCIIHAERTIEWSLLLTLHGEAIWNSTETATVCSFLTENFQREPVFESHARTLLGKEMFAKVSGGNLEPATTLNADEQQRLLMLYVPKKVAQLAHEFGWRVETVRNLRYGGSHQRAPMVTWIFDLKWDQRVSSHPDAIYRESLQLALSRAGYIAEDGSIL